jgi:hypothetical protein
MIRAECASPEKGDEHDSSCSYGVSDYGASLRFDDVFCRYVRRGSLAVRHTPGVALSPASRRRPSTVRTTAECGIDIAGTCLFSHGRTKTIDVRKRRPATIVPNIFDQPTPALAPARAIPPLSSY